MRALNLPARPRQRPHPTLLGSSTRVWASQLTGGCRRDLPTHQPARACVACALVIRRLHKPIEQLPTIVYVVPPPKPGEDLAVLTLRCASPPAHVLGHALRPGTRAHLGARTWVDRARRCTRHARLPSPTLMLTRSCVGQGPRNARTHAHARRRLDKNTARAGMCPHAHAWRLTTRVRRFKEWDIVEAYGVPQPGAFTFHKQGSSYEEFLCVQGAGCRAQGAGCRVQGAWHRGRLVVRGA